MRSSVRSFGWISIAGWLILGAIALSGGVHAAAQTQESSLRLDVEQGFAGLDGYMRPGHWSPIRLSIDNRAADDREVLLSWELADEDGDRVLAQRRATLTRQRDGQPVWLYAPIPMTTRDDTRWTLRAIDTANGQQLAEVRIQPNAQQLLRQSETLIAVTSAADLGLNDIAQHATSHEPIKLVRGLSLTRLPDRWHGLQALHALIWTQDLGENPADPLRCPTRRSRRCGAGFTGGVIWWWSCRRWGRPGPSRRWQTCCR